MVRLSTPTQNHTHQFEKRIHTPPTTEREKGKTTPTKFLKGLSNSVFRKNPMHKFDQESKLSSRSELNFTIPSRMSKRVKTPKPLNLPTPMSPPKTLKKNEEDSQNSSSIGSFHSADMMDLGSPVTLQSPCAIKPRNLTHLLHESFKSPTIPRGNLNHYDIDNPKWESLEEPPSTYFENVSHNMENVKIGKSFRKYVGEACSICQEEIFKSFKGEKMIELKCSHVVHNDCYLTMFEEMYPENNLPVCSRCDKPAEPHNEDVINSLRSSILQSRNRHTYDEYDYNNPDNKYSHDTSTKQYLEIKRNGKVDDFNVIKATPVDQIIKTADISCDGLKDLNSNLSNEIKNFDQDVILTPDNDVQGLNISSFVLVETNTTHEENKDCMYMPSVEYDKKSKQIAISFNESSNYRRNLQDLLSLEDEEINDKEFRSIITEEIRAKINTDIEFEELIMFDRFSYSTNGEDWRYNQIVFFFQNILIFYDNVKHKVTGKVPTNQISNVNEFDNNTGNSLILNLKSTVLPEIYLGFEDDGERDNDLINKWKYYLSNRTKPLPIAYITSNSINIFSQEIFEKFNNIQNNYNKMMVNDSNNTNSNKPWINESLPLRLIVCINLSCFKKNQAYNKFEYKSKIVSLVKGIINNLSDNDLFGLVIVGKDGQENVGKFGTFIGMIDKNWDEWDNIIKDLEVIEDELFDTLDEEISVMLETCYRLSSTFIDDPHVNEGKYGHYNNQLIILNKHENDINIDDLVINRKFTDNLFQKGKKFHLNSLSLKDNMEDNAIKKFIVNDLNRQYIRNLRVKMNRDITLLFGDMKLNETKMRTLNQMESKSITECNVDWFDIRTSSEHFERIDILHK